MLLWDQTAFRNFTFFSDGKFFFALFFNHVKHFVETNNGTRVFEGVKRLLVISENVVSCIVLQS